MATAFDRVAILGDGPEALRVVLAARELGERGSPLSTIALHTDRAHRASVLREAGEVAPLPAGWPEDPGGLREALIQTRAGALWCDSGVRELGRLAALCAELGIAFVPAAPSLVAALTDPDALRRAAVAAGWSVAARAAPHRRLAIVVIADREGRVRAPAIADVTIRRAGEPVLVECPAGALRTDLERAVHDAAVRLAAQLHLVGVATIEAEVSAETSSETAGDAGRFAFVGLVAGAPAHAAIEAATGLDLVKLQLYLRRGGLLERALPAPRGHAFALRLTREDPERGFALATGDVALFRPTAGVGLRVDAAIAEGDAVGARGDRTLATIVAWATQRDEALARLGRAMRDTSIAVRGGATNKACLVALCARPELARLDIDDGWLDHLLGAGGCAPSAHAEVAVFAAAIATFRARHTADPERGARAAGGRPRGEAIEHLELRDGAVRHALAIAPLDATTYRIDLGRATSVEVSVDDRGPRDAWITVAGRRYRVRTSSEGGSHAIEVDGVPRVIEVVRAAELERAS